KRSTILMPGSPDRAMHCLGELARDIKAETAARRTVLQAHRRPACATPESAPDITRHGRAKVSHAESNTLAVVFRRQMEHHWRITFGIMERVIGEIRKDPPKQVPVR